MATETQTTRNRIRKKCDELWNEVQDHLEPTANRAQILKQVMNIRERIITELFAQSAVRLVQPEVAATPEPTQETPA